MALTSGLTMGVAALARPTFDVPFAEQMKESAFAALAASGIETVGPRELLFDRGRQGYTATELGRVLASHAERIETQLEEARASVSASAWKLPS